MKKCYSISLILIISIIHSSNNIGRPNPQYSPDPYKISTSSKIGENPFPTNPMNDRARGYLLQGKAQTSVINYGNYIDIEVPPNGAWGNYAYLYEVSFLAGIPGQSYSSNYHWVNIETIMNEENIAIYGLWESHEGYEAWYQNGDTNFVGIIFDSENDFGRWDPDSISKKKYIK